jgi:hypothetical protein
MFTIASILSLSALANGAAQAPISPVWPNQFNATLAKVNPFDSTIIWTKLFYDWTKPASRFDFYNSYVHSETADWTLNCSIIFAANAQIWHVYPQEKKCHFRANDIPSVSPNFVGLLNGTFKGHTIFRGVAAELWEFPDPEESSFIMKYYAKASDNTIPLRSPNQFNDRGDTDFFDVQLGPQNEAQFKVPEYCMDKANLVEYGCPPDDLGQVTISNLIKQS